MNRYTEGVEWVDIDEPITHRSGTMSQLPSNNNTARLDTTASITDQPTSSPRLLIEQQQQQQQSHPSPIVAQKKWLRIVCHGKKIKIRPTPSVQQEAVGMLSDGEELAVLVPSLSSSSLSSSSSSATAAPNNNNSDTINGFYKLADGRGSNEVLFLKYIIIAS